MTILGWPHSDQNLAIFCHLLESVVGYMMTSMQRGDGSWFGQLDNKSVDIAALELSSQLFKPSSHLLSQLCPQKNDGSPGY